MCFFQTFADPTLHESSTTPETGWSESGEPLRPKSVCVRLAVNASRGFEFRAAVSAADGTTVRCRLRRTRTIHSGAKPSAEARFRD